MAEESLNSSGLPLVKTNETGLRKHSGGKSWFIGDRIQVSPRYLRAPTPNCHHICKYGAKQEVKEEEGKVLSAKKKFEKLEKSRTSSSGGHELHKLKGRVSNVHEVSKSSSSHLSEGHETPESGTSLSGVRELHKSKAHVSNVHEVSKPSTSHLSEGHETPASRTSLSGVHELHKSKAHAPNVHEVSKPNTSHLHEGHEASESRTRLSDGSELPKSGNTVLSEKKKGHETHESRTKLSDGPELPKSGNVVLSEKKKGHETHESRTRLSDGSELPKSGNVVLSEKKKGHETPESRTRLSDGSELPKSGNVVLSKKKKGHEKRESRTKLPDGSELPKSGNVVLSQKKKGHETTESRTKWSDGSELPKSGNVVLSEKKKGHETPESRTKLSDGSELPKSGNVVLSEKKKGHETTESRTKWSDGSELPKSGNVVLSEKKKGHETPESRTRLTDGSELPKSGNVVLSEKKKGHEAPESRTRLSDGSELSKSGNVVLSEKKKGHETPESRTRLTDGSELPKSGNVVLSEKKKGHEAPESRTRLSDGSELPKSENVVLSEKKKWEKLTSSPKPRIGLSGVHEPSKSKSRLSDAHEASKSRIHRLSDAHETPKSRTRLSEGRELPKSGDIRNVSKLKGSDTLKSTKQQASSSGKTQPSVKTSLSKGKSPNMATKSQSPTVKLLHPTPARTASPDKAKSSNMATKSATLKTKSPAVKPLHPTSSVRTASPKVRSSKSYTDCANLKPKSPAVKSLHSTEPMVGGLGSRRNSGNNLGKASGGYKVAGKKVLTPSVSSSKPVLGKAASSILRKQRSLKITSPSKSRNTIKKSGVKQPDQDEVQEKARPVIASETENRSSESCGFDEKGNFGVGLSASPSMTSPKSSSQGECEPNEFDQGGSSVEDQNKIRKSEVNQPDQDEVQEKTGRVLASETENIPSESCGFDQNGSFGVGLSASPKSSSQGEFDSNAFDQGGSSVEGKNKITKSEVKQPGQDEVQEKTGRVLASETENRPSESCGFDQNGSFGVGLSASPKSSSQGEFDSNAFDQGGSSVEGKNKITKSEVKQPGQDEVQEKTRRVISSENENRPSESCGFDQKGNCGVGLSASPSMTSPKSSFQGEFEPKELDQGGSSVEGQSKIRRSEVKQPDQDEVQEKSQCVITSESESKPSESCGFDQNGNFGAGLSASPSITSPKSSFQGEFEPNEFDQGGSSVEGQNKIRRSEVKQPDQDEVQEKSQCVITSESESKPSESCGFDQNGNFAAGLSLSPSIASLKSSFKGEYPLNEFDQRKGYVLNTNKISQDGVQETLCVITSEIKGKPSESYGFNQNGNSAAGLSVSPSMTSPKSSTEGGSLNEFDQSESSVESQDKIRKSEVKQSDQDEIQQKTLSIMAAKTENRPSKSCGSDQNVIFTVGSSASPSMTSPKSSSQGEYEVNEFDQSECCAELSQHPASDCDQSEKVASPLKSSTKPNFALASHDDAEEDYYYDDEEEEEEDYDDDEADDIDVEEEIVDYLEKSIDTEVAITSELKRMVRKAAKVHAEDDDDDDDDEDEVEDDEEEDCLEKHMDRETALTSSELKRMVRRAAKVHAEDGDEEEEEDDDEEEDCRGKHMGTETAMTSSELKKMVRRAVKVHAEDGDDEEEYDDEEEDCRGKHLGTETAMTSSELKKMVRRAVKVHAEEVVAPRKLTFRRGKVIEIQTEDDNGPRRLKFRRGRVLDEDQIIKALARRRNFKARIIAGERNGSETGPENVVLRHQEMQKRKEEKGLFNNVIEETASKLAGTKKSKVKALVGAFETVISLQDLKSSASTPVTPVS